MSVKIVGGDQYIQAVNQMAKRVPQAASDTVKRYTVATQAQAVRLEPVKTGFLNVIQRLKFRTQLIQLLVRLQLTLSTVATTMAHVKSLTRS